MATHQLPEESSYSSADQADDSKSCAEVLQATDGEEAVVAMDPDEQSQRGDTVAVATQPSSQDTVQHLQIK